jgi:hypothetical protein
MAPAAPNPADYYLLAFIGSSSYPAPVYDPPSWLTCTIISEAVYELKRKSRISALLISLSISE